MTEPTPPADLHLARCPACRLQLTPEDAAPCARCGSELALVRAAYVGAWADVALARRAMAAGDRVTAWQAAQRAVSLVTTPTTLALLRDLIEQP